MKLDGKNVELAVEPFFNWVLVCKLASGYLRVHGQSARRSLAVSAIELWLEVVGEVKSVPEADKLYKRKTSKVSFVFELIT